jgi:hypothetical protein
MSAPLPHGLFQNPEGFVEAAEEFLEIVREEDHRLPFKAAGFPVFAFHDVEVKVPQTVFFDIEKIGSVGKLNLGGK